MSDDLVKRPVLRIYTEATSDKGGIWAFQPYAVAHTVFVEESNYRDLEDRIEAAEKELQEMQAHIDHADAYHKAMLAAEAERDDYKRSATHSEDVVRAARAEIERLRAIGTEMAESIQGNYYLPSVATRWFTALKGQRPEPWPSSALKEAVDFAEQTFPYLAQKDNSHE